MTTTRLSKPTARVRIELQPPAAAAIVIFCLIAIAALIGKIQSAPTVAVPTPGLVILIATQAAVTVPLAAPEQQVSYQAPPRYVTAWAAPDGLVLGPIPWHADSPILGRYGDMWVLTTWDNGQVWVRASDIGLNLADVAPQIAPAPQVVYVTAPETRLEVPAAPILAPAAEQSFQVDSAPQQVAQPIPTAQPTPAPLSAPNNYDTDVERNWMQEQWKAEHCFAGVCR